MGKLVSIIGLDPAFRKGGFAACKIQVQDGKQLIFAFVNFADFPEFLSFVKENAGTGCIWGIENSNLQNATFAKYYGNASQVNKISRNVGANQAVSQIAIDILRVFDNAHNVYEISPKQKGNKWTASEAKAVLKDFGWEQKTTNQDQRDALKIALIALKKAKLTI